MTLAYRAGFFDGDGCVSFARTRQHFYPRVLVTNTDRGILEAFQARFGGDIYARSARRPGWKVGWSWRLSWSRAVQFLEALAPWLRVKLRQAQTVFAWNAVRLGTGCWPDEVYQSYFETLALLRARLTWLNTKGDQIGADPILAYLP